MMRREICLIAIILSLIELVELVSSRSKSEDNGDKDNYNGSNTLINRLVKTVRDQSNRRRSADILLMTNDLVQSDEARQFCGETLYYVVEYYCVFVKGTSVYVPNENDDNVQFDDDNSSVGEKKNNELKSKRKRQTLNGSSKLFLSKLYSFVSLSLTIWILIILVNIDTLKQNNLY